MNTAVLKSKGAIALYVGLLVLIATVFGYEDIACKVAEVASIEVEMCAEPESDV